ncbi:uncharacterized protein DNG_07387 [Cephalotrichum gorgonifer]|uniref:Major facilitator superfamily (MFS) profile domain-containing protein n=1 Tax=Cephalotrichum gorgonifer TaxID=2041049 RepID=A0AAE8N2B3_9PEZI|nr:uncharacterized protein DNG_07387 [Cephalotrichum gorgonifer]
MNSSHGMPEENVDQPHEVSSSARDSGGAVLGDKVANLHPKPGPYSVFTNSQRGCIIAIVAFAGWFSTASSFIYFPAIPFIASDLGTTVEKINLTVTSYLIASGIVPSITGRAADIFGRRPVLILSLSVYAAVNIALAVQRHFAALFVLRMVQSAAISG